MVITDALDMKAISAGVGHAEGAVRSLAAGADLLCIGNPGYPETYDADERLGLSWSTRSSPPSSRVGSASTDSRRPRPASPP